MSDPTDDLREEFLRDIRGRFRRLRGAVRRWVGYEEDIFGLAQDSSAPATDADRPDDAPQVFRFQSDREQASAFALWFLSRLRWSDAGDARVCPICERLDGREIPLTTIDEATFTFEPGPDDPDSLAGEYALKPPIHPGGRCVLLPVIG